MGPGKVALPGEEFILCLGRMGRVFVILTGEGSNVEGTISISLAVL
jgi:hypothetical protein